MSDPAITRSELRHLQRSIGQRLRDFEDAAWATIQGLQAGLGEAEARLAALEQPQTGRIIHYYDPSGPNPGKTLCGELAYPGSVDANRVFVKQYIPGSDSCRKCLDKIPALLRSGGRSISEAQVEFEPLTETDLEVSKELAAVCVCIAWWSHDCPVSDHAEEAEAMAEAMAKKTPDDPDPSVFECEECGEVLDLDRQGGREFVCGTCYPQDPERAKLLDHAAKNKTWQPEPLRDWDRLPYNPYTYILALLFWLAEQALKAGDVPNFLLWGRTWLGVLSARDRPLGVGHRLLHDGMKAATLTGDVGEMLTHMYG